MERKQGLRRNTDAARRFQRRSQERAARNMQQRQRAGEYSGLKRTGGPKPKPKPRDPREAAAQEAFFARLGTRCENCGHTPDPARRELELEQHHCIRQQTLRSIARSAGLDEVALIWDPDWGMTLCTDPAPERCHDRHTLRVRRVPRGKVPPEAWIAAEALDDQLEAAGQPRVGILELTREHP